MDAKFFAIDEETWPRRPYFDYFYNILKCRYALNANIDITALRQRTQECNLKFFPTFLYAIMRSVNQNREFRMSFDASGRLGYWNYLVPVYTLFHKDDTTFSDIWSEWNEDFVEFYRIVVADMEIYKDIRGIKARPMQPANFCSVSALPWLSFTGFAQDTYGEPALLSPLIRFGKYFKSQGRTLIPLTLIVHHAVADGYHSSKLINDIQELATRAINWTM